MKSFMAKPETIQKKWYLIDADGQVLGRLASQVAAILRGKNKPEFTPNADCGDYSGKPGNLKEIKYGKLMAERSDFAVMQAIKGMLPKNSLGAAMLKKVRVYKGAEHEQQAQQPQPLTLAD